MMAMNWHELWIMAKPRVNMLIVFCAMIGMLMSIPADAPWNMQHWQHFIAGNIGIALFAGAAAMLNCLIEEKIDALMARTRARPSVPRRSRRTASLASIAMRSTQDWSLATR